MTVHRFEGRRRSRIALSETQVRVTLIYLQRFLADLSMILPPEALKRIHPAMRDAQEGQDDP